MTLKKWLNTLNSLAYVRIGQTQHIAGDWVSIYKYYEDIDGAYPVPFEKDIYIMDIYYNDYKDRYEVKPNA